MLIAAHEAGQLQFFGAHAALADTKAFAAFLAPFRQSEWVSIRRSHSADTKAVLAYLGRYTHRVAISNRRLIAADATGVTFKYKDYRIQGPERYKLMTIATGEFIRRFLMHVLPKGFDRIRHDGLLANGSRADNVAKARALLNVPKPDMIPAISNLPTHASRRRSCVHAHAAARSSSRLSHGDASQGARPATAPPVIRIDRS